MVEVAQVPLKGKRFKSVIRNPVGACSGQAELLPHGGANRSRGSLAVQCSIKSRVLGVVGLWVKVDGICA